METEEALGINMMEMDMRHFDAAIGRWVVIDPITHHDKSTYSGFDNNPVFWADPSGGSVTRNDDGSVTIGGRHAAFAFTNLRDSYSGNSESSSSSEGCDDCNICPDTCGQSGGQMQRGNSNLPVGDSSNFSSNSNTNSSRELIYGLQINEQATVAPIAALAIVLASADGPAPVGDTAGGTILLGALATIAVVQSGLNVANRTQEIVLDAYDQNWLYAKQEREINRILTKEGGPPGLVYALTVNVPGKYPDVRGNLVTLNAGDVWKYGETTKGINRYGQSALDKMIPGGVSFKPLFFGNTVQIKVQEKIMIYGHVLATGSLPPGNRIFR